MNANLPKALNLHEQGDAGVSTVALILKIVKLNMIHQVLPTVWIPNNRFLTW